jgi:NitT/TauT family transport system substrate-binding protein
VRRWRNQSNALHHCRAWNGGTRGRFQARQLWSALLLSTALLVSNCTTKTSAPIRIAIGGQAQLIYLAATMAQQLDYYKAEGLNVELLDFPGGQKSLEALLGGSTDVVCGFYDHTIQMAAKGQSIQSFVTILRNPGLVAVSTKAARVEDLKGKVAGVSSAGSSTQMFLNYLLTTHGMKPDDVSVASIGMSATAVAAVTHDKVQAAIMTDPALAIVSKQTKINILADTRTAEGTRAVFGVDTYPSAVLYSTPAWLDAHRDNAQRLARAMLKTLEWMRTKTPEEIREKMPASFRSDDPSTDLQSLKSLQAMLSIDGKLTTEAAAAVQKVLSVSLPEVSKVDLSKTYTNEFVTK